MEPMTEAAQCDSRGLIGGSELANSPIDRLKNKKRRLESQLNDVNAAISALEQNPEVLNILTLLSKAGH